MMKLNQNMTAFLKANVKPEYLDLVIKNIKRAREYEGSLDFKISSFYAIHGKTIEFHVDWRDFKDETEPLKPHVWYPMKEWCKVKRVPTYWLEWHPSNGRPVVVSAFRTPLQTNTHFMLIDLPEGE